MDVHPPTNLAPSYIFTGSLQMGMRCEPSEPHRGCDFGQVCLLVGTLKKSLGFARLFYVRCNERSSGAILRDLAPRGHRPQGRTRAWAFHAPRLPLLTYSTWCTAAVKAPWRNRHAVRSMSDGYGGSSGALGRGSGVMMASSLAQEAPCVCGYTILRGGECRLDVHL